MSKPPIHDRKIVALTGAGISAPSGLATFRGADGLWRQHRFEDLATPGAWQRQPELVNEFYNERRAQAAAAQPNAAHRALAELERGFEVVIVTQNVDDLHERAGSSRVIHLHGEISKARSTADPSLIYPIGGAPIRMGDACELGSQLRPHIVWFGESVLDFEEAKRHVREAGRFLVIGTSLEVFPAAGLVKCARFHARKFLLNLEPPSRRPFGFHSLLGPAEETVPALARKWLSEL